MVEINYTGDALRARIERAIAKVDRRLRKVVDTLSAGDLPYAIVGGHAANFWVSTIDDSAVRTSPDIEIVISRGDLPRTLHVLRSVGFTYEREESPIVLRDGESTTKSDVVRVHLAEESIEAMVPMEVGVTLPLETFTSHSLKLHRLVDQLYLRDMIDAGLVDAAWLTRLPAELAARLKELLDDPHG